MRCRFCDKEAKEFDKIYLIDIASSKKDKESDIFYNAKDEELFHVCPECYKKLRKIVHKSMY